LSLADAAARLGLRTTVVAPEGSRPSTNTFGAFADRVPPDLIAEILPRTGVDCGDGRRLDLGRPYALLDNAAFARRLPADVVVVPARVLGSDPQRTRTVVHVEGGGTVEAAAVVDASGAAPVLVKLQATSTGPAFQSAAGLLVEADDEALAAGTFTMMDWSAPPYGGASPEPAGSDQGVPKEPPTFLYAFARQDGLRFYEETALCARPAVPLDVVEARLRSRLARRARDGGLRLRRVVAEERLVIPMGIGLPRRGQRVAAFGAAAGLVHPATGYSVAASVALAPVTAQTIADGLSAGDVDGIGDRVLGAVWTPERLALRRLYLLGREALVRFSLAETRAFFAAFFASERSAWTGYLDETATAATAARAMWRLFAAGGPAVRRALLRSVPTREGLRALPAILGGALPIAASRSA
jgi:lycopene cyclase-like protein